MPLPPHVTTVLLDIDGTLLDSNAAHAKAWAQALTEDGMVTAEATIRPLVGMGGDKLLPIVAHIEEKSDRGQALSKRKLARR